jgi:ubiquinone biosynthesis protein
VPPASHVRLRRARRALEVARVARRSGVLRVLREIGVVGDRPATREGAEQFRLALEELGTTYIKLGQLLSSRPDLLPDPYIAELGKLVDSVPPEPFAELEPIIREDLGEGVFASIDPEPLATASIAQIHPALLASGREVVVKVRRPGIVEQVAVDLEVLRATAKLLEGRSETAQLLHVRALADELESHLRQELDFVEEASNAELMARNLEYAADDLTVPQVIRPYVSERVLVLERIHGRKLDDGHGLDPERAHALARVFFAAYVRQVTVNGVYHADPHRGNVLLTEDGRLALLDFGLLGRLDEDTRRDLALLLLALAQNRADDVADLLLGLSLTTLKSDEVGFKHEVRRKLPQFHWRSLSGIRTGEALADLQRIALQNGVALPTSFALVGKTLAQADSIARSLDPALDPVELLESDALEVMAEQLARALEPNRLLSQVYTQGEPLLHLPRRAARLLERAEAGQLKLGIEPTGLDEMRQMLASVANRLGAALIIVGLLIASALMARVNHAVSLAGFAIASALGLFMLWKILTTPGEL